MRLSSIRSTLLLAMCLTIAACSPAKIQGSLPSGGTIEMAFYPGGNQLDDLVIIDKTNYFGKAQYQMNDPLGDIGFRFTSGDRVQAECTTVGKNIIGKPECQQYTVYRSTFALIPEGTTFLRPKTI